VPRPIRPAQAAKACPEGEKDTENAHDTDGNPPRERIDLLFAGRVGRLCAARRKWPFATASRAL